MLSEMGRGQTRTNADESMLATQSTTPGSQAAPSVCILTTVWNQVEKTVACLETAVSLTYPHPSQLLLVDNGSSDDTIMRVQQQFPQVQIIQSPTNLGFAGGYNLGLKWVLERDFDYVFLINNDILIQPDALTHLATAAEADPQRGMVTAKIYYNGERQRLWSVGGNIHPLTLEIVDKGDNQLDGAQWDIPRALDFAPLCAVLIRTSLLRQIGLLDDGFFLYYEDMDFARRVRQAGFQLWYEPRAVIYHDVSASSGGQNSPNERYWMARSSVRYFRKHGRHWWAIVPWRTASALRTTLRLLRLGKTAALQAYWRGLWHGLREEL